MPPKAKIPAPIDRPLSRAYLREFSGWSTAYPPGLSDPTSLRIMENVQINRDGSCRIRPGLRYLSYEVAPFSGPVEIPGVQDWGSPWKAILVTEFDYTGINPFFDVRMDATYDTSSWGELVAPIGAAAWAPTAAQTDPDWPLPNTDTGGADFGSGNSQSFYAHHTLGEGTWELKFRLDSNLWLRWTPEVGDVEEYFFGGPADGVQLYERPSVNHSDDQSGLPIPLLVEGPGTITMFHQREVRGGLDGNYFDGWIGAYSVTEPPAPDVGIGSMFELVGTHEAFFLNDGSKAYLFGVREEDGTVGFRVLQIDVNSSTIYELDHPGIDFDIPQGTAVLNFSAETTYVKYLQIDNKIFALSNAGEAMRVFHVGTHKLAKALLSIVRPEWDVADKLTVVHPDAAWITSAEPTAKRVNRVPNPSFETNIDRWQLSSTTGGKRVLNPATPVAGNRTLQLRSLPERTNLATHPLHDVATLGTEGWAEGAGEPTVEPRPTDTTYMRVHMGAEKGVYYARSRMLQGVEGETRYRVAYDTDEGDHVQPLCRVRWYGVNGAQLGDDVVREVDNGTGRWVSAPMMSPKNAVSMRVYIGGENKQNGGTSVYAKNLVICKGGENTNAFHGDSGTNYFWTGVPDASASVYHPPKPVTLISDRLQVGPGKAASASIHVQAGSTVRNVTLALHLYNKNGGLTGSVNSGPVADTLGGAIRVEANSPGVPANATHGELWLTIPNVARDEYHYVDAAMLEVGVSTAGTYFDGDSTDTSTLKHRWSRTKDEHASRSQQIEYPTPSTIPSPEARTADTLIATGGPSVNTHSFGFFYTFNNEVGESAASMITVRRAQRGWTSWLWETPNAVGEPSGTETEDPAACADQLVAYMPQDVFDEALAQGAVSWSLYMFTWSDQDPVPVTALKVGTKQLPIDADYGSYGWIRVTPLQPDAADITVLPSEANRYNYSEPPTAGQGLVASDRMVLVHDPNSAAVIRWSSNRQGEYTNFTANKGGGYKTLTSGNLFIPAAVKLWQNPQSVDTLTILCMGTDGHSTGYYMAPVQVASQSEATNIMGFEETTATPGTTSPYGVEVFNNALYHPLDDQLMKSTASNYNISHKSMTDQIRDVWEKLATKEQIRSAVHDNRIYYIVNNPDGAPLEEGYWGNEVWVFDAATKDGGTWSRFLIPAMSLRKIEFGRQVYMSVVRPDGIYYLDPDYGYDDVVDPTNKAVSPAAIDWRLETNTQGANRAHDAWCHLQQLGVGLGNFTGAMRYGIRAWDLHGQPVEINKIVRDDGEPSPLTWDLEDFLLIRRDLKEWFFYAESIGEPSFGQINLVQYRYTPSSVNTGYEYGSVETFEYGKAAAGLDSITTNGVPAPMIDTRRP